MCQDICVADNFKVHLTKLRIGIEVLPQQGPWFIWCWHGIEGITCRVWKLSEWSGQSQEKLRWPRTLQRWKKGWTQWKCWKLASMEQLDWWLSLVPDTLTPAVTTNLTKILYTYQLLTTKEGNDIESFTGWLTSHNKQPKKHILV